jgi:hypothetical protein
MAEGSWKEFDPLGARAAGRALEKVTEAAIAGVGAVLKPVCVPAAEEYGLLLRDKVSAWRAGNLIAMMKKLEQKLADNKVPEGTPAHPRVVRAIIEQSSWIDDAFLQEMWAGLLASSITEAGDDDSNLVFTDLLGGLTRLQARVLKYACEKAEKRRSGIGLISAEVMHVSFDELYAVAQDKDVQRLDRELDRLRALGLLDEGGGFAIHPLPYLTNFVALTPTPLALHMYVRCSGSRASPVEFFGLARPATEAAPGTPASTGSGETKLAEIG